MIIRRHIIGVAADLVGEAAVCDVRQNKKVASAHRGVYDTFSFSGAEARAGAVHKKRIRRIFRIGDAVGGQGGVGVPVFYEMLVYLLRKVAAAFQCGYFERRKWDRVTQWVKQIGHEDLHNMYILQNISMSSISVRMAHVKKFVA
ncbi:hypothetical protein BRYFOR_06372 [Marvinbryantia formatexigens DSM 14469]|uniref:Uncharacterized protein n=1 Tax=Marvinbryantia formatexigens DSM 14469 TaxID=478749 RepID=C6LCM4_9FIRM|nr:hypothetical protein BRYFOR_06372 [Marvinbryantia formatexigens DSM 14469]